LDTTEHSNRNPGENMPRVSKTTPTANTASSSTDTSRAENGWKFSWYSHRPGSSNWMPWIAFPKKDFHSSSFIGMNWNVLPAQCRRHEKPWGEKSVSRNVYMLCYGLRTINEILFLRSTEIIARHWMRFYVKSWQRSRCT
jgi:hypothetical protein